MLFTSLDHTRDLLCVPFISMFISIQLYPKSLLADSSATAVTRADMAHPLPWVWLTCSLTLVLFISGCMQYVCSRNTAWLLSAVRGRATYYMSKDSRKIAHEMSVFFLPEVLYHVLPFPIPLLHIVKNVLHQVISFFKRENIVYCKLNTD